MAIFNFGWIALHTPTSVLKVVSVYTMKSQGISGVVRRGKAFSDTGALQRFLPPCPLGTAQYHVGHVFPKAFCQ